MIEEIKLYPGHYQEYPVDKVRDNLRNHGAKISEIIESLQQIKATYGDLYVVSEYDGGICPHSPQYFNIYLIDDFKVLCTDSV